MILSRQHISAKLGHIKTYIFIKGESIQFSPTCSTMQISDLHPTRQKLLSISVYIKLLKNLVHKVLNYSVSINY
jgi:hypothetical protein